MNIKSGKKGLSATNGNGIKEEVDTGNANDQDKKGSGYW